MTPYELQRQEVLKWQAARVSLKEEHSPSCTHPECEMEREARQALEDMPEHQEAQVQWGDFILELRNASLADDPPEELRTFEHPTRIVHLDGGQLDSCDTDDPDIA